MTCDEKPVSDQYPELFHYTQASTFEKIYCFRQFRATHYEHLTDSSELNRFRLKVCKFIVPHIRRIFDNRIRLDAQFAGAIAKNGGVLAMVEKEAARLMGVLHQGTFGEGRFQNTFICSFCAHDAQSDAAVHGLLSQWRGYGEDGVAIVLDTEGMEDIMYREKDIFAHSMNHIGDVKYDDNDSGIQADFCKVFKHLPKALEAHYSERDPCYEKMFDHFVQGSTLVKDRGFWEEREVRIVVSPRLTDLASIFYMSEHEAKPEKMIGFFSRDGDEIPYIDLFGEAALPIKRVIVGPSRNQNLNYQKILDLVAGSCIKVALSNIPYLGKQK